MMHIGPLSVSVAGVALILVAAIARKVLVAAALAVLLLVWAWYSGSLPAVFTIGGTHG